MKTIKIKLKTHRKVDCNTAEPGETSELDLKNFNIIKINANLKLFFSTVENMSSKQTNQEECKILIT